jgi:hypothetical protein
MQGIRGVMSNYRTMSIVQMSLNVFKESRVISSE